MLMFTACMILPTKIHHGFISFLLFGERILIEWERGLAKSNDRYEEIEMCLNNGLLHASVHNFYEREKKFPLNSSTKIS